ncbi:sigma 54-interacting transcriptional regulator [Aquabacterium sp. OR-4]|uniref:sigma 54-interacting transcriptional regulator n=1 Tax=Aquabacterium sp. OR-4 TaxID=2978127 RepID=UPI0028C7D78A|nr:sigma 54-interacting transcriptional regulator [Aquabacterium sp. OR-4]MDT7837279.1 sigma 54-interacting transcriptional regulator [Aquabacterium sp. OR-4]
MPRSRGEGIDWRAQEMLLLAQVMRQVGRGVDSRPVLREMLHLMSELLGLNRGRIVLAEAAPAAGGAPAPRGPQPPAGRIAHAYGLTAAEITRGMYAPGEGVTGRVLATGQPAVVQDVDAEPAFLFRCVPRHRLPPETVAFIALPIELEGRTLGVLACHRIRSRSRPLADDVAVLGILATLAGRLLQLERLVAEATRGLQQRNEVLTQALRGSAARYGIVGSAPALLNAIGELERVSAAQATVLLLGESGTGKELFARALHLASPRRDKAFVKVNCAAIPDTLFESELFGHERGAFTGAQGERAGWFELAHGGTIFLDEIGELPLALQTKLLRTLQEGTVVRLGGQRERRVDVRLVAATHRDLEAEAAAGRFRRDLFYRLFVIPIRLPALRERRDDIALLAAHFLNRANQAHQRNVILAPDALQALARHDWPGNIRELGNLIERLVLLSEVPQVDAATVAHLLRGMPGRAVASAGAPVPAGPVAAPATQPPAGWPAVRDYRRAESHPRDQLAAALAEAGGNRTRAAQRLGLTLRQFSYRCAKHGL